MKKLLLGLGTTVSVIAPIAAVVACGKTEIVAAPKGAIVGLNKKARAAIIQVGTPEIGTPQIGTPGKPGYNPAAPGYIAASENYKPGIPEVIATGDGSGKTYSQAEIDLRDKNNAAK